MKLCPTCDTTLDPALISAGIAEHPNCAHSKPMNAEQLRAAIGLLADRLGARLHGGDQ